MRKGHRMDKHKTIVVEALSQTRTTETILSSKKKERTKNLKLSKLFSKPPNPQKNKKKIKKKKSKRGVKKTNEFRFKNRKKNNKFPKFGDHFCPKKKHEKKPLFLERGLINQICVFLGLIFVCVASFGCSSSSFLFPPKGSFPFDSL